MEMEKPQGSGFALTKRHRHSGGSSILPLMALNSLYCVDVPLSNYSLTHSLTHSQR